MRIALVNTNRIRPAVAPIGLDYVAEALDASGHQSQILDLCWADDPQAAIAAFFSREDVDLVGITLRNTDDCDFGARRSFVGELVETVHTIREHTGAKIVLGGAGFSVMPEPVLDACGADFGVWADGEFSFPELANRLEQKRPWHDIPSLIWHDQGVWRRNPPSVFSLANLPRMSRAWIDNRRYLEEGEPVGIETKRGCPCECIYCADPIAKGKQTRPRAPQAVVEEIETLMEQDIAHLQTCDSEFNLPEWHALEICQEIIGRNIGHKIRWQAMCSPSPFSAQLAQLMRRAGCVGVNLGVDNGDEGMLKRLKRGFAPQDILNAVDCCKQEGIEVMVDLLIGGPGETRETIASTLELMKRAQPDKVNVALGIRIYPGTELARQVERGPLAAGVIGGPDPDQPLFFVEPEVAPFASEMLDAFVSDTYERKVRMRRATHQALLRGLR